MQRGLSAIAEHLVWYSMYVYLTDEVHNQELGCLICLSTCCCVCTDCTLTTQRTPVPINLDIFKMSTISVIGFIKYFIKETRDIPLIPAIFQVSPSLTDA